MAKPIVAIVGRPNVGKSTLFNKLIGQRLSIVEDTPGVTRDRVYAPCSWNGRTFMLVDTGGIELSTDSHIMQQMRAQAEMAIETADLVVLMTDVETGVTAADQDVADMLLKAKKKILLAVNKVDGTGDTPPDVYEFYNLGLGDPYPISSVHGLGTGDLLDRIVEMLPPEQEGQEEDEAVRVAVIGKPNAGKSSLVNCILGQQRVIVSSEAGTTRDAVDTPFENENGKYIFIDTAGLRRRRSVEEDIEKYSVIRANMAIERADVCLILIDGTEGVTEQDTKVAGLAHESGKACVIVVNKWDAVEKDERTMDEMRKDVARKFSFMSYAPIAFISAKTGQRVNRLFELINYVHEQNCMRISTGRLNEVLADALLKVQPPTDKGKRLKILYMTQVSVKPPTFVIFCNRAEIFHFSYQRYLENQIRSVFGLEGTCIRFIIREKARETDARAGQKALLERCLAGCPEGERRRNIKEPSGQAARNSILGGHVSGSQLKRRVYCLVWLSAGQRQFCHYHFQGQRERRCARLRERKRRNQQCGAHHRAQVWGCGHGARHSQGLYCRHGRKAFCPGRRCPAGRLCRHFGAQVSHLLQNERRKIGGHLRRRAAGH